VNNRLKLIMIIGIILCGVGCASVPVSKTPPLSTAGKSISPSKADITPPEPEPPDEDIIAEDLPVMSLVEKKAPYLHYETEKFNLELQGSDIKDVLLLLANEAAFGLVIDPGITGNVPVMALKEATLKEVLSYILPPLKLKYKWEGNNLHIFQDPLITRYFNLDYLSSTRQGKRQVSFSTQSSLGGGGSGGAGGAAGAGGGSSGAGGGAAGGSSGGQNQSSSQITTDYKNTTWNTFIESLKVLVFGSLEKAQSASSETSSSSEGKGIQSFAYSDASGKRLIISPETGIIVVTASEDELKNVSKFIDTYEGSAHRQVWIEAKIVEVNLFKAYQMGIDWGLVGNRGGYYGILGQKRTLVSPAAAFTPGAVENQSLGANAGVFQFAVSNNILDIMVDAIARQGNLKVLASPRIAALNNEKAVIRVVREETFFNLQTQVSQGTGGNVTAPSIMVQVVPIGIVMDIIPQIGDDGQIMLNINPDISELLETRRFEVQGAMATQPVIDRRSIDTTAKLTEGQTLVIAGIIKERKSEVIKGIPFLYKLPLLGNLFRRTEQKVERTELVIFITPKLHVGKTAEQLTQEERQRVKDAVEPFRLGDSISIPEGLKGEFNSLKKEKKQKE